VPSKPTPSSEPPRVFDSTEQRLRTLRVVNKPTEGRYSDAYHALIRISWLKLSVGVVAGFLVVNALFGLVYFLVGGVTNARPDSYLDHFFFSVHTFGTIGYGSMYPGTVAAEAVMTTEALVSVVMNALLCGLAFARFARPRARVMWSQVATVCDREGEPMLMFRVANERMNHVVEANVHVTMLRTEVTREGERVRRLIDLPLVRDRSPSFALTWTVMHPIVPGSPLYGVGPSGLKEAHAELVLTLTGLDETLAQSIHARTSYLASEIVWGERFEDVILPERDGRTLVDYGRFHLTKPSPLSWEKMGLAPPA
jgi:inward rectifier potassium channel